MTRRVMIQSFDWRTLKLVQQLEPGMQTMYLTVRGRNFDSLDGGTWTGGLLLRDFASVGHMVKAAGGTIWAPAFADLSAEAVKDAQQLGLKVIPWTVNQPADAERLIDWGVDGLISDYPDPHARAAAAARHRRAGAARPTLMGVAALLLAAIVIASLVGLFAAPALIERSLFRPYWLLPRREYSTLVTSAFVHADLAHLIFNAFTFWAFAFALERAIGSTRVRRAVRLRPAGERRRHLVQAPPRSGLPHARRLGRDPRRAVRLDRLFPDRLDLHPADPGADPGAAVRARLPRLHLLRRTPGARAHQPRRAP